MICSIIFCFDNDNIFKNLIWYISIYDREDKNSGGPSRTNCLKNDVLSVLSCQIVLANKSTPIWRFWINVDIMKVMGIISAEVGRLWRCGSKCYCREGSCRLYYNKKREGFFQRVKWWRLPHLNCSQEFRFQWRRTESRGVINRAPILYSGRVLICSGCGYQMERIANWFMNW